MFGAFDELAGGRWYYGYVRYLLAQGVGNNRQTGSTKVRVGLEESEGILALSLSLCIRAD